MTVQMTVRDESVTKGMRRYAEEKADRLSRFFDGVSIEVILDTTKSGNKAEILLAMPKGDPIAVTAENEQMNAAIDAAINRAERSLVKRKEKLRDHRATVNGVAPVKDKEPDERLESYQDIVEQTEFPT